jgi:hypothetical protein
MVVNGLIGTVLSELLWLLGCFYTSSLVATLAISLTIPLTMLADVLVKARGDRLDDPFLKKHFYFFKNNFW